MHALGVEYGGATHTHTEQQVANKIGNINIIKLLRQDGARGQFIGLPKLVRHKIIMAFKLVDCLIILLY